MRKTIITLCMFLIIIPMVLSETVDDLKAKNIFNYIPSPNGTHDNSTYNAEGVLTGSVYSTTSCLNNSVGCFYGADGDNDHVDFSADAHPAIIHPLKTNNISIAMWINVSNMASGEFDGLFVTNDGDSNKDGISLFFSDHDGNGDKVYPCIAFDSAEDKYGCGWIEGIVNNDQWDLYILEWNTTDGYLYLSVNLETVYTDNTDPGSTINTHNNFYIGKMDSTTNRDFKGYAQMIVAFNNTLTNDEKDWLYNGGQGRYLHADESAPPAGLDPPVITISYPTNNSVLNNDTYFIQINGTATVAGDAVNATWINDSRFSNKLNNATFNFTADVGLPEGKHIVKISANNSEGDVTEVIVGFTVDISSPTLTSSLDTNNTLFYAHRNITYQVNFSDNLQVYSFNISTPEGYKFNITGLDTTQYFYNGSINASNYGVGLHYMDYRVCDAHTALDIEDWYYETDDDEKEIKFFFGSEHFSIRPQDPSMFEDYKTDKLRNKYKFEFKRTDNNTLLVQSFVVSSTQFIDIIGNKNDYNAWLVIPSLEKWIDFNIKEKGDYDYTTTRINDRQVKVDITGIDSKKITFESAGDLNCIDERVKYYIYNYTATYTSSVVETTQDLIVLTIDFSSLFFQGNGSFIYNDVEYQVVNTTTMSKLNLSLDFTIPSITTNQTNQTFYWDFYLNDTKIRSINFTQLVKRISLSACGSLTQVATLNVSIYDEDSVNTLIEADVDAVFNVWTNDSNNQVNFSFDFNSETNYSICIFPNTTVYTNAYLIYNASGEKTHRWFLRNARLDNQNVSYLNLYNFKDSTGLSELRGTLRDSAYEYYPNVITKLQRFYTTENVWRTVQMDRSDDFGFIFFNIKEKTTDYRLIFLSDDLSIDETESLKFACSSSICTVTFIVVPTETLTTSSLSYSYGYDNISEVIQLNWSDSTGLTQSIRFVVSSEEGNQRTIICDSTVSSNTGTINCNTTGVGGLLMARVYKTQSPTIVDLLFYITKLGQKIYQLGSLNLQETGIWTIGIATTLIMGGAVIAGGFGALVGGILSFIITQLFGFLSWWGLAQIIVITVIGIIIVSLLKTK